MLCVRKVPAQLQFFVKEIWVGTSGATTTREHVLPTGDMHLAFRLTGPEVRLYNDSVDQKGAALGFAVVGGPRSSFYVKEAGMGTCSAGVILRPGAALALFGIKPIELVNRHIKLSDLWGSASAEAIEQLQSAASPQIVLARVQTMLSTRLPEQSAVDPAAWNALTTFDDPPSIRDAVRRSGYSHRRFLELFREAFGLSPKAYCRVRRFRQALDRLASSPTESLSQLALTCGYSDQPHFNREFLAFAGVTPTRYRTLAPRQQNHVPVNPHR